MAALRFLPAVGNIFTVRMQDNPIAVIHFYRSRH